MESKKVVNVAVQGCTHGHLDQIYGDIESYEDFSNLKIDLLLCCGDYQSCRNMADLQSMSCPNKYKKMQDFFDYYSGKKKAPVLTIFVGGNHEASVHNLELYFGGWAAPNIYFLGHSGCVNFKGLRICGQSGIYKKYDYNVGYKERVPFSFRDMKSIYHHRFYEEFKLCCLSENMDILMTHDWPSNVWKDEKEEYISYQLEDSGHMHCKFKSTYILHKNNKKTEFLALSQPARKNYMDFYQIPVVEKKNASEKFSKDDDELRYDDFEWLGVLRLAQNFFPTKKKIGMIPISGLEEHIHNEMKFIEKRMNEFENGRFKDLRISQNPFVKSQEAYTGSGEDFYVCDLLSKLDNPQRTLFLKFLNMEDKIKKLEKTGK